MENNIVNFIESLKCGYDLKQCTGYDLYEAIKENDKLLWKLCDAAVRTYDNIEHLKGFLG